ncbi:MAG: RraA family protein [Firmicutes bacterium]|nr:RraA family protein [Bacillota bacterium]
MSEVGREAWEAPFTAAERQWLEELAHFSSATLHEAGAKFGALPPEIKPLDPGWRLCGVATTVATAPYDNLWIHRAIYAAAPGSVLVVDTAMAYFAGYWGGVMTHAAMARGLGGLVIDGCVRDAAELRQLNWPVFSRGLCIQGTRKEPAAPGGVNIPVRLGQTWVYPRDLVVGDEDGVVVIRRQDLSAVLERARQREAAEAKIREALRQGATTLELYGW